MSAKDKAIELVIKYWSINVTVKGCGERGNPCLITSNMLTDSAIQCALIAVDEIIESHQIWSTEQDEYYDYYNEVKKELLNLKM